MPGLSGFEVCQQLRARPSGALVPIIMLTGLDDGDSVQRAFDVGATDFISKPINWTLLRFRIRYVLRSAQVMKELVRNKESLSNAQRIARLGSWEWFVPDDDRVQRSDQYYRLFGQPCQHLRRGMEAVLDHVYVPDRPLVAAALDGARQGIGFQLTYRVVWPDGSVRTVLETVEPGDPDEGAGLVMEGSAQDITDQVDAQRRIRQLAYFDHLTGLPNREFFRENLLGAAVRCLRNDSRCAVMVVDIDRFARINDSLGPERGDQVLQVIGHRLRECMGDRAPRRAGGRRRPAQLQGGPPGRGRVRHSHARRGASGRNAGRRPSACCRVVRAPIHVPGQDITLSARIGLAVMPDHGRRGCPAEGRRDRPQPGQAYQWRPVALFSEEMKVAAFLRFTLEGELRRAIGEDELRVVYQPIVDANRQIVKAEALVRWPHMGRGPVPPPEFISLAEETGMIVPLSRRFSSAYVPTLSSWGTALPPGFRISVNLSGVNFMDAQLIPTVRAELEGRRAGLAHRVRAHRNGADARSGLRHGHPGPVARDGCAGGGG
jgi:GGDEF domain-containing protein/PAS domain-containing protein